MSRKTVLEKISEALQELENLNFDKLTFGFVDYERAGIVDMISGLDEDQQKEVFKQINKALLFGKKAINAWHPIHEFLESGEWEEADDQDCGNED